MLYSISFICGHETIQTNNNKCAGGERQQILSHRMQQMLKAALLIFILFVPDNIH